MESFASIPRPPHHPMLGHFPDWLGKARAQKVLDTLLAYAEACGGLARVPLGPARMLLLSDPQPIAELLSADDANFKGWPYRLTRVVLDNVLLMNGEAWSKSRSLYRRALRAADATRAADAALEPFVRGLRADRELDLAEAVGHLTADCVTELLVSARYPRELEPHRARVQYELAAVGIDLQCQPWAYLSRERWVAMRRSVDAMRAFFARCVDERLARREERTDVLAGFLEQTSDRDPLRDGLVNFFFTAHDVLTSSTTFCLWLLASHPSEQARVRAGEPDALDHAVRESLRLYPGYPLFSRRTRAPLTIAGHRVPAGTDVLVSPWVLHRLERHWPDARAFRPERWRGLDDKPVGPGPRGAYMPFGGGHRSCIAFALAFPLVTQIVRRVLAEAQLEAKPAHEPDLVYWGSVSSANGLPVRVSAPSPRIRASRAAVRGGL